MAVVSKHPVPKMLPRQSVVGGKVLKAQNVDCLVRVVPKEFKLYEKYSGNMKGWDHPTKLIHSFIMLSSGVRMIHHADSLFSDPKTSLSSQRSNSSVRAGSSRCMQMHITFLLSSSKPESPEAPPLVLMHSKVTSVNDSSPFAMVLVVMLLLLLLCWPRPRYALVCFPSKLCFDLSEKY